MSGALADPAYYVFSVVGLLAATLHFANGLWSFGVRWGITVGPRAQRISRACCGVLFVALSLAGVVALRSFVPEGGK